MDNLTILEIFLLSMLLPMTIWSLITKSIPNLKMRHSEPYLDKIVQLKDCLNVQPVDVEDVKYIKRHINNNTAFIGSLIGIDILAILALINISMHEHISFASILIYIAALGLPSAICLYKGIKNTKAFNNHDSFNKRTGRKIAAGLAFLLAITCCVNAVINFNVVTVICLPVSMIISYFICAGVPYINYIVAAFMAIGIIITMPYNITNLQILYLAESVMGVIAICILSANKAVKEHFQKL